MSQLYKDRATGPVPPPVPTTFVTDVSSPAVPALNILNVYGADSTGNNNYGIETDGSSGGNTLTITLTNRIRGTVTTTDATVGVTVATFALGATPGVFTFSGDITAYNSTDVAGGSYGIISGIRTTGAAAVEIGKQFTTNFEEAAMVDADIDVTVAGNNVVFTVTGLAGKTINWDAFFTYRFVS